MKDIARLGKENAELKEQIEQLSQRILEQQKTIGSLTDTIDELKAHCKAVDEVNEKMKNFYNCSHSNRALCPNEHNCKGCKDWELAE